MMKLPFLGSLIMILFVFSCAGPNAEPFNEEAIRQVLLKQQEAWNRGDIQEFMNGYWRSPELRFFSSGRTAKGWAETLKGYQKTYPDQEAMGQLTFEIFDIFPITDGAAGLNGAFQLERQNDNPSGTFTLIFKQVEDQWKIISDMTCAD